MTTSIQPGPPPQMSNRQRLEKLRRLKELSDRAKAAKMPDGLTLEQQRALAKARARKRKAESGSTAPDAQQQPARGRGASHEAAPRSIAAKTPGQARDNLHTLERLEAIPEAERRPAEQRLLAQLRASQSNDTKIAGELNAALRGFQQGITFNLSDEAGAALRSMTGMQDYDAALGELRNRDRQARAIAPGHFRSGEFAGAAGSGALPVGAGLNMARGGTLGARTLWSGAGGAAAGFAQGYGAGEGETVARGTVNRIGGALPSAVVGGTIGAAAPGVGAMVGAGVRRAGTGGIQPVGDLDRRTTKKLVRDYQRSTSVGIDPQAELTRLGPEATLADIIGPFRANARGLAAMPGAGGTQVARFMTQRDSASPARIQSYLDAVAGSDAAAQATRDAQRAIQRDSVGPMYDAALQGSSDINTDVLVRALEARIARAGPATKPRLQAVQRELGGEMSAEKLHNIRSDLSDDIAEAQRAGRAKQVRALSGELQEIDHLLDANAPGYAEARAGYATSKAIEQAVEDGRQALSGGPATVMRPDALREKLGAMPPEARDAYRRGAREWIDDRLRTAKNERGAASDLLKSMNRDKLRVILGNREADDLFRRLEAERTFAETRQETVGGLMTAMRQEAARDLGDFREPDTQRRPGPIQQVRRASGDVVNAIADALIRPGVQHRTQQLGQALTAIGSPRDRLVRALAEQAMRRSRDVAGERIGRQASEALVKALSRIGSQEVAHLPDRP